MGDTSIRNYHGRKKVAKAKCVIGSRPLGLASHDGLMDQGLDVLLARGAFFVGFEQDPGHLSQFCSGAGQLRRLAVFEALRVGLQR